MRQTNIISVKQFFYFTIFFASIGTIVLVASNPKLVQQGASYLGVAPAGSQESSSNRPEDEHLAKFLSHYSGTNTPSPTVSTFPVKPETMIIPPPIHATPSNPEPLKAEPPKPEPPKPELPKNPAFPMTETAISPIPPFVPIEKQELPPTPIAVQSEQPATIPKPVEPTPVLPAGKPVIAENVPTPSTININTSETPEETGFASSRRGAVPAAAIESLEKWSEPPILPSKNEPLPFAAISPETTTNPPVNPAFPLAEHSPISPETGNHDFKNDLNDVKDPFLQTLNSQPVTPVTPYSSVSGSSALLGETPPPSPISPAPTKSVYDVQPLPPLSPLPLAESQTLLQQTSLSVPQPVQPKIASQFQINPVVMAEEVPCHGTETVARVGTQVILMCDLLPQLRRAGIQVLNENLKRAPDEERAKITEEEKENFINMFVENQYPAFLQEQVMVALVFNDYLLAKSKEEREMFDKKFGEEFDQHEIPAMIKEFGVRNNIELKQYLKEKLGSSLDRERMLWIRSKIAQQWIMFNMQEATGECTHDEMMEFYTNHKEQFTSESRVQWQELFVAFSNHKTEEAARNKIAWMGNQVAAGYPFEEIAKVNSEGFTAAKGGLWDWTKKGSLTSPELEQAVFSLPADKMSPIIKGDKGFHIIRVVKREETKITPFIEAQVTIRERIKMERRQKLQTEYFAELKKRYPTRILREQIDFKISNQ
ncbi:MAG: peptidylprolyl isomerase [Planctomycetaceae bacterium]|jgi:hypothetical protein|nr:peptidylprolyl isomerase [Planctomycetaceae bacterium]